MSKREIGLQRGTADIWMPNTEEDLELTRTFKANQIIVCKITGGWNKKQRSFQQLSLLMAAIRVCVYQSRDPNWSTVKKAKMALKYGIGYFDEESQYYHKDLDLVITKPGSFSYDSLDHMDACKVFDKAFMFMADHLGIPVEQLIDHAMRREYPRGIE